MRTFVSLACLAFTSALGCRESVPGATHNPAAKTETVTSDTSALVPPNPAPAAPPLSRPERPLNVLLLTVDSLRADMPWTGYPRQIAPNLSELAKESAVWENHRSVASYTAQTVATWLSGQYATSLYRDGWFFTKYAPANLFFTEVLKERNIRTIGLHAHMYFGRDKGLEQGFDTWEIVPGISFDAQTDNHVTSPKSAARLLELLEQPEMLKRQFFAWCHFMDPHDQYVIHEEAPAFGKKNRDRYDSEVFYTDLWLGKVLAAAKAQPYWEQTAVIVTGDHGEAFGEHGMYKHAFDLWDVLVRVPLLIRVPGARPVRIGEGRTHIDLAPTILDLMGQPRLEQFAGQSLVPEIYGAPAAPRPALLLELAEDSHNPGLRSVIAGDDKLIVDTRGGRARLFNLRTDPGELDNLARREPDKVARLLALLQAEFQKIPNVEPHGGMKLVSGRRARGPEGPATPEANAP